MTVLNTCVLWSYFLMDLRLNICHCKIVPARDIFHIQQSCLSYNPVYLRTYISFCSVIVSWRDGFDHSSISGDLLEMVAGALASTSVTREFPPISISPNGQIPYTRLITLGPGENNAISQMVFSNAFSWKKTFWFIFHWSVVVKVQWPGAVRVRAMALRLVS